MNKNKISKIFSTLTDSKSIRWILRSSRKQFFNLILLTILNILFAVIAVANSYMLKFVINSATGTYSSIPAERLQGIAFFGTIFAALILTRCFMTIWSNHLVFKITARLTIDMKTDLYSRILRKNYAQITKYHTGEMLNRLNNDVSTITNAITTLLPGLVFLMSKLVGIFAVLYSIDPIFTLAFLGVGVFVFGVSLIFRGVLKKYHKLILETDGKVRSFMQETLSSLLVVKIFRSEDKVVSTASELQEINYKRKSKRNIISLTTHGSFGLAFNAAYLFGLFYCGSKIAVGDPFRTYGTLSQVLSLISQISAPLNSLTSILPTYYAALGSAERIIEFEEMDDEVVVNDENLNVSEIYSSLESIVFDNITFSYDREMIFDSASLEINKGDLVVMTGISGIGKSTLTKLLLGVFPIESGEIYLNMKNGEKLTVDCNMRRLFSYVPQGNFLLSGTLRDNIVFTRPSATEEEIQSAISFACADFVRELPEGIDTVIGEKGMGLSEGQVQRIAIARAILSEAPVILLDEATSALDEVTELKLLDNIKKLSDKTCVLISHKKAANSVCNKEVRIIDRKITVIDNNEKSKA